MAIAIRTGTPQNGEEIIIERPDGCRVTVLAHANPIRDAAGRLLGAVNVLVDISDRKREEATQSKLGAIVESSDDAIIGKTVEGQIQSWNAGAQRIFLLRRGGGGEVHQTDHPRRPDGGRGRHPRQAAAGGAGRAL